MVSEKHMEAARKALSTAWAEHEVEYGGGAHIMSCGLMDRFTDAFAAALANAEREGMRRERERCANLINIIVNVFKRCEVESQWTGLLETLRNFVANPDQPGSSSLPADSAPEAGTSSSTVSGVTNSNPRLTSAGTPPVDAANCERVAQAADASPSYSELEA